MIHLKRVVEILTDPLNVLSPTGYVAVFKEIRKDGHLAFTRIGDFSYQRLRASTA